MKERLINILQKLIFILEGNDDIPMYCDTCGTCGYIGCCGVKSFLEKHVKGKTNCEYEDSMIEEIEAYCREQKCCCND